MRFLTPVQSLATFKHALLFLFYLIAGTEMIKKKSTRESHSIVDYYAQKLRIGGPKNVQNSYCTEYLRQFIQTTWQISGSALQNAAGLILRFRSSGTHRPSKMWALCYFEKLGSEYA